MLDFNKPNIMLDLETMGNGSNAAIIAIGAVEFTATHIKNSIEIFIDLQSCLDKGLEVDGSTVMWWVQQSAEARARFSNSDKNISIVRALSDLTAHIHPDSLVWGNGAAFDNVILANAYRKCNMPQPWKYWNDRCYRTMKNLHPRVPYQAYGVEHSALDDAIRQAKHLQAINKQLLGEK